MTYLHAYQCRVCKTTACMPFKADYVQPLRCNLCRSFMTHLYAEEVTTPAQEAWVKRGLVYNPHAHPEAS
jgi:hypothetical protein